MNAPAPSEPLTVEVIRSGLVESVHRVDVAVCDAGGQLRRWAGDPAVVAFLRSSAKPVQAAVCLEAGWQPAEEYHLALACGSHSGEALHVDATRSILAAAGLGEDALRCPPSRPFVHAAVDPAPVYHNCSGKHAAMAATCRARGWPVDDYPQPGHPLQALIAERVAGLAGIEPRVRGVDGCGVPTFAYSLIEAAALFARLPGAAPRPVAAMRAHPFFVAGTDRLCTVLMESLPGVVLKIGAEGIACAALPDAGIGIALKARDGMQRGRDVAATAVLEMLGVLEEPIPQALAPFARAAVLGGGRPAGSVRWTGELRG